MIAVQNDITTSSKYGDNPILESSVLIQSEAQKKENVHVSGGEGYEHKANAYERLVNASLSRSWNSLFRGGVAGEKELINAVDEMLKYYMDIDHEIIKNNKSDSIANHVGVAFQRWCDEHPIQRKRFDSKI